jgi:predicted kinase
MRATFNPESTDTVIVVSGIPASGETTLARRLGEHLGMPVISKDTIKEALFDVLGTGDLERSRELGRAAHVVMYALATEQRPVILESFFLDRCGRVGPGGARPSAGPGLV